MTGQSFSGTITLPGPGAFSLDLALEDAAGNRTLRPLSLFADLTSPVVTGFDTLPDQSASAVDALDVSFSEPIDLATFTAADLRLTLDGTLLTLPEDLTINLVAGTTATYRIEGLQAVTAAPGLYSLQIETTGVTDLAGNSGLDGAAASFTITAPPSPGVALGQSGGTTLVAEGGSSDSYTLTLQTQPTAEVRISLSTSGAQLSLNSSELIFTPDNWNTPQSVVVSAVDDALTEGSLTATIQHSISSTDANYEGVTIPALTV